MSREFPHINLAKIKTGKAYLSDRYYPQDSEQSKENARNKGQHIQALQSQSLDAHQRWVTRNTEREAQNLPALPTSIPLTLKCDPETFNADSLLGLGFEVVSEQEDGFILVASEDANLEKFEQNINGFLTGQYGTASIAKVHSIVDPEDDEGRLKRVLTPYLYENWSTILNDRDYIVEISIECAGQIKLPGSKPIRKDNETLGNFNRRLQRWQDKVNRAYEIWDSLMDERLSAFNVFVDAYHGEMQGIYHDDTDIDTVSKLADSFSVRVKINGNGLRDITMNHPYVFEIAEPDDVTLIQEIREELDTVAGLDVQSPDGDAGVVCVIDSGIQEGHVLIQPALIEDLSKTYLRDENLNDEASYGGHGTRVAGAILYPNGIQGLTTVKLNSWIVNLKVLDATNSLPEYIFPPLLIEKIIDEYAREHGIKIFNHSIAANSPCRMNRMSMWAAAIDKLSYENDILLIQAVGNLWENGTGLHKGIENFINDGNLYPNYLSEPSSRIANPAQSLSALSVGSISPGTVNTIDLASIGNENEVSAFSRSGLGIWDTIKPEVVEYGGNYAGTKNAAVFTLTSPKELCIELPRISPEGPLFSKDAIGTSFSTPKVSSIASQLSQAFRGKSSLFYKTLIVQSAKWPGNPFITNSQIADKNISTIGFGLPNLETALFNNNHRITAITQSDELINEGDLHLYEIGIPEELRRPGEDFDILVEVTLCYTANPRRTRRNNRKYLSTWVDWIASNINEPADEFKEYAEKIEDTESVSRSSTAFRWMLGSRKDSGVTSNVSRNRGLTQKDWAVIKSHQLTEGFCIAVRGRKGWDSSNSNPARYCLAVSFESLGQELPIYNQLRTQVQLPIELRVGV